MPPQRSHASRPLNFYPAKICDGCLAPDRCQAAAAAVEQEMSKNWMGLGAVLSILVFHQKPQPIRPG
jgi:hypothetical protein